MQKLTLLKKLTDPSGHVFEEYPPIVQEFRSLKAAQAYVDSLIKEGNWKMNSGVYTSVSSNKWSTFFLAGQDRHFRTFTFYLDDKRQYVHSVEISKI